MRRTDIAALGLLALVAAFIGVDSASAPVRPERPSQKPAIESAESTAPKKAAVLRPVVLPPPPVSSQPQTTPGRSANSVKPSQQSAPPLPVSRRIAPLEASKPSAPVSTIRSVRRTAMTPKASSRNKSKPITAADKPVEIAATENLASGRVMLRLLEHDAGPQIRLIWPDDAAKSAELYRHLSTCFGMISAVMTVDGKLFRENGAAGRPWALDTDRFSGFIRAAEGALPSGERRIVSNIRARHRVGAGAIVRVFPRWVDAGLLTGMQAIAGPAFRKAKRIDARYVGGPNGLYITGVEIDGTPAGGRIRLRPRGSCG